MGIATSASFRSLGSAALLTLAIVLAVQAPQTGVEAAQSGDGPLD